MKIAVLPGDGIGPEIVAQAAKVLEALRSDGLNVEMEYAHIGGAGYDAAGDPFPAATEKLALAADAVLLGAVGGYQYDTLPRPMRPEQGLLRIRKGLGLFANLRPAMVYPELVNASSLKPELVSDLEHHDSARADRRYLFRTAARYSVLDDGERQGFDTMHYNESEVRRVAHVGFQIAMKRGKKLCSVDKANVLDTSMFWREIVTEIAKAYPEVALSHMYVDNAAMQLVRAPKQFDVILTGNIFGDILSDEASMLTGSIGMLPSASLDANNKGLYEPCHGSAPDIAGKDIANPLATILSVAMMMRYTFAREDIALRIEGAVRKVLQQGLRTGDIYEAGMQKSHGCDGRCGGNSALI